MNLVAQDIGGVSPSEAGVAIGSEAVGVTEGDGFAVYLTTRGATGGTLSVALQTSSDGVSYFDWYRSPDVSAAAAASTVKLTPAGPTGPTAVGTGTASAATLALTKGVIAPGPVGSRLRVVYDAGTGTSVGATQNVRVEFGHRKP
jgi:hypothetical protein